MCEKKKPEYIDLPQNVEGITYSQAWGEDEPEAEAKPKSRFNIGKQTTDEGEGG